LALGLQWGRDQLVAEMRLAKPVVVDLAQLQWGRDQLVAEMIKSLAPFAWGAFRLQWGRDQLVAEIGGAPMSAERHPMLQWGRDQLVAEIWQDARPRDTLQSLQWGRDQLVAEMVYPARGLERVDLASMGPRPIGRGNDEDGAFGPLMILASMGPRPIGRGNYAPPLQVRRPGMLQWGRDQLVAEIPCHLAPDLGLFLLQWGRDQLVAEIGGRRPGPGLIRCFNGAATNWSRKFGGSACMEMNL